MSIKSLEDVYTELQKEDVNLQTKYSFSHEKTDNKSKRLSIGKIWFNLMLPEDYPLVNEPVDKKKLNEILYDIYQKYPAEVITNTIWELKKESFKIASIQPCTFNIDGLILPEEIEEKRKKLLNSDLESTQFNDRAIELAQEYLDYLKETNIGVYNTIVSGSKGNISLIANIMIGRGSTLDIENDIGKPIKHSLNDGYNIEEYFQAAKVARRAFFIVANGTSEPGALSRRIMYSNSNIQIQSGDCKTKKYLVITPDKKLIDRLVGRWYMDKDKLKQITFKNKDKLIGKEIKLRSPIFCKSKNDHICEICYGQLAKETDTKLIGILAGSAINSALVESYSMAAKHSTGSVDIKPVNFKEDILEI